MISKTEIEKRKKRKSNPEIITLINLLKKQKAPIFKAVAAIITRPRRKKVAVNIEKINKLTKDGSIAVIPGKVLAKGELDHEAVIVALKFSETAKKKLEKKANLLSFYDFIQKQEVFKNIPIKIIT